MAVKTELIRNGRVSVSHYDKDITVLDIEAAFKQFDPILDNATAPIHSIADFSEVKKMPSNLLSLARSHRKEINHPMTGNYIVITNNMFLKTMINSISRFIPSMKLKMVATMDEALAEVDRILAAETQAKIV